MHVCEGGCAGVCTCLSMNTSACVYVHEHGYYMRLCTISSIIMTLCIFTQFPHHTYVSIYFILHNRVLTHTMGCTDTKTNKTKQTDTHMHYTTLYGLNLVNLIEDAAWIYLASRPQDSVFYMS